MVHTCFPLQLLHVREFGAQADFKDLCLPFTLNDVICSYCNDCRDLDLCRDDELLAGSKQNTSQAGGGGGAARDGWSCRVCGQPYHRPTIESRLLATLQRRVRDYQLQDLECVRCKQVSSGHLRASCSLCSGDLRPTLPPQEFKKKLVVFRNMAEFHGFQMLEQSAAWLLADDPGKYQPGD